MYIRDPCVRGSLQVGSRSENGSNDVAPTWAFEVGITTVAK